MYMKFCTLLPSICLHRSFQFFVFSLVTISENKIRMKIAANKRWLKTKPVCQCSNRLRSTLPSFLCLYVLDSPWCQLFCDQNQECEILIKCCAMCSFPFSIPQYIESQKLCKFQEKTCRTVLIYMITVTLWAIYLLGQKLIHRVIF